MRRNNNSTSTNAQKRKAKFRNSKIWKDFRKELRKKQKVDPVTGAKLTRRATCHHMDLREENYEILSDERQIMVNYDTHGVIHYLFGVPGRLYNWRRRVLNLIRILKQMELLNKEK